MKFSQQTDFVRVYLHGFMGMPRDFSLVQKQAPGISLRLPLALPQEHFLDYTSRVVGQLVNYSKPPWHVIGYSLGGRIALGIMQQHPQWIAQLTLIGAHPGLTSLSMRKQRWQHDLVWQQRFEQQPIAEVVDAWLQQPLFAGIQRWSLGQQHKLRLQRQRQRGCDLASLLRTTSLARMPNFQAMLQQTLCPVHLIAGGDDSKFVTLYQQLWPRCRNAWLSVIPNSSHLVPLEQPVLLAKALRLRESAI